MVFNQKCVNNNFDNGPEDLGSIPGRVIPKNQKMVLDASLPNTQHYKIWIKDEVGQSKEKGAFGSPLTAVNNFTLFIP